MILNALDKILLKLLLKEIYLYSSDLRSGNSQIYVKVSLNPLDLVHLLKKSPETWFSSTLLKGPIPSPKIEIRPGTKE